MLNLIVIVTMFILCPLAASQTLIPVGPEMFAQGNYWIWQYKDHNGSHSSFEKYLVRSRRGNVVSIEMQSQLKNDSVFTPHHRFTVDISKCTAAYLDYRTVKPWRLESFQYRAQTGTWQEVGILNNVQIFEEKFLCHQFIDASEHRFKHSLESSYLEPLGEVIYAVAADKRPRPGHFASKYIFQPYDYAGIAGFKEFNPNSPKDRYTFELYDWQMN